jgi:hypothetical protein
MELAVRRSFAKKEPAMMMGSRKAVRESNTLDISETINAMAPTKGTRAA